MANNILVQNDVQAKDVGALNRSAICSVAVQNGQAVAMDGKSTTAGEADVWTVITPATATLSGLWIAYSPEVVVTASGSNQYKGIDPDPRNFTNVADTVFDVFKPKVGDILQYTVIAGTISTNTFAIATDGVLPLTWASAKISGLSLELIATTTQSIGTGTIGVSAITAYVFEVVAE